LAAGGVQVGEETKKTGIQKPFANLQDLLKAKKE
jgi:hypothetical protein